MRQTVHNLELAMYQCSASIETLEQALLSVNAFEPSNLPSVLRTGCQLALDDMRVGALLYVLLNQN